eukprot:UN05833
MISNMLDSFYDDNDDEYWPQMNMFPTGPRIVQPRVYRAAPRHVMGFADPFDMMMPTYPRFGNPFMSGFQPPRAGTWRSNWFW